MNKVIHCAVRRDLRRFRTALDKFPGGDKARAAALHTAWVNFQKQLTEHHEGEHAIAWPALKAIGVAPTPRSTTFDEEHEAMAADAAGPRGGRWDALSKSGSAADAQAAAAAMATLEPGDRPPTSTMRSARPSQLLPGASWTTRRSRRWASSSFAACLASGGGRVLRVDGRRRVGRGARPPLRQERPGSGARHHRRDLRAQVPQGGRSRLGVVRLLLTFRDALGPPDRVVVTPPRSREVT